MAHDPAARSARDLTPRPNPRDLERVNDLRFTVAGDEPDLRGWPVYASTGREVGIVADLLVDPAAREIVMLDVDVGHHDEHALAPIRAAFIDHAARRVVVDARAIGGALDAASAGTTSAGTTSAADAAPRLPTLPRSGPLSDADIERFDAAYVRAYGARAADADVTWRVPRGAADALQFAPPAAANSASGAAAGERRLNRVDDASALDDEAGIDPRELDARVRIEEGATVDDDAPVAGVRYEGEEHTPHDYGRPDEAYGAGFGSGRIGFNKVVSREPYAPDPAADARDVSADDAPTARAVRYRRYDDRYAGPER